MSKSQKSADKSKASHVQDDNPKAPRVQEMQEETPSTKEIWKVLLAIQSNTAKLLADNEEQRRLHEELKSSLEFEAAKREELEKTVSSLQDEVRQVANKFKAYEEKLKEEQIKCDDLQQYTRKYNLEISGADRDANMTDTEIVLAIAKEIDVDIVEKDLDIVHRLKGKKGFTPPIIVRFSNYKAKQRLYKARKLLRGKDWSVWFGYATNIYINENLTQRRGKLFKEVRGVVKERKFYGSWTIDGKIFLKRESDDYPMQIKDFDDIKKL